jgi:hypothetical protein
MQPIGTAEQIVRYAEPVAQSSRALKLRGQEHARQPTSHFFVRLTSLTEKTTNKAEVIPGPVIAQTQHSKCALGPGPSVFGLRHRSSLWVFELLIEIQNSMPEKAKLATNP